MLTFSRELPFRDLVFASGVLVFVAAGAAAARHSAMAAELGGSICGGGGGFPGAALAFLTEGGHCANCPLALAGLLVALLTRLVPERRPSGSPRLGASS